MYPKRSCRAQGPAEPQGPPKELYGAPRGPWQYLLTILGSLDRRGAPAVGAARSAVRRAASEPAKLGPLGPDMSGIWPDQCASPSPTGMIDGSRLTPSVRKPTNQDSDSRFPNPRVLPGATWATPRLQKMRIWIRIFGGHLWPFRGRLGDPPRLPQGLPCGPSGTFWGLSPSPWILFTRFLHNANPDSHLWVHFWPCRGRLGGARGRLRVDQNRYPMPQ